MLEKIIITCAITGGGDGHKINPAVPITPRGIANESISAAAAGASIVHIHVRDPNTGAPSMDFAYYEEVVKRIRDTNCDVIINLTTGPGARYTPSRDNPRMATPDSTMADPEERVRHVLELKPEICSLDIATMNFGNHAFVNIPDHLIIMAKLIQEVGVKPELEVFDLGHVRLANDLIKRGIIGRDALFQICLGIPWGAEATAENMLRMRDSLPSGVDWAAFGISGNQFPSVALAVVLGGNVRVGLEDNVYLGKGKLAPDNASLVHRAVRIIEDLGASVATADEARMKLGLRKN